MSRALCNRCYSENKKYGPRLASWQICRHQNILDCVFLVFPTSIFMKERITIQDVDKNCKPNLKQSKAKMSQALCNRRKKNDGPRLASWQICRHQEVLDCFFFLVFPTSIFTTEVIAIRDVDKNFNQNAPISGCFTLAFLNDSAPTPAIEKMEKMKTHRVLGKHCQWPGGKKWWTLTGKRH